MLKKVLVTSLFASTLAFMGCASTPKTSDTAEHLAALQQKDWVVTEINRVDVKTDASKQNLPTLRFGDSSLTGTDGCNRIMGGYSVQGKKIQFLQLAKTQMMCMDGEGITAQFNETLERVSGYKASADKLELLDDNSKVIMKFKKQ